MKLLLFFNLFLLGSCATSLKQLGQQVPWSKSEIKKASFEFKMEDKEVQIHKFTSSSRKKSFVDHQIRNEKEESVDFTIQYYSERSNPYLKNYPVSVSSIEKDGFVNLRDLGFPELGERMLFVFDSKGRVLSVDDYAPDSVYFIPNFVMPESSVELGDTWSYERAWISESNSIPLNLKLVSILKSYVNCGNALCADIELSGTVEMDPQVNVDFKSELAGRMLVEVDTGRILWQKIRTEEQIVEANTKVTSNSCTMSVLDSPVSVMKLLKIEKLDCEIQSDGSNFVEKIPY